jgi:hypothetical protein
LAKSTAEIATGCPERQNRTAWQEMVERLLFNGVDAKTSRLTVRGEDETFALPLSYKAERPLSVTQTTLPWAEIALDLARLQFLPVSGDVHHGQNC